MSVQQDRPWALVPADVAEWMGMWEAVPMPEAGVSPAPAPAVPAPRSWRDRLHVSGRHLPGLHLSGPRPK
jgi:hypothetical protein